MAFSKSGYTWSNFIERWESRRLHNGWVLNRSYQVGDRLCNFRAIFDSWHVVGWKRVWLVAGCGSEKVAFPTVSRPHRQPSSCIARYTRHQPRYHTPTWNLFLSSGSSVARRNFASMEIFARRLFVCSSIFKSTTPIVSCYYSQRLSSTLRSTFLPGIASNHDSLRLLLHVNYLFARKLTEKYFQRVPYDKILRSAGETIPSLWMLTLYYRGIYLLET